MFENSVSHSSMSRNSMAQEMPSGMQAMGQSRGGQASEMGSMGKDFGDLMSAMRGGRSSGMGEMSGMRGRSGGDMASRLEEFLQSRMEGRQGGGGCGGRTPMSRGPVSDRPSGRPEPTPMSRPEPRPESRPEPTPRSTPRSTPTNVPTTSADPMSRPEGAGGVNPGNLRLGSTDINIQGGSPSQRSKIAEGMSRMYEGNDAFKQVVDSKSSRGMNIGFADLPGNVAGRATVGGNQITMDTGFMDRSQLGSVSRVLAHEVAHNAGMGHGPQLDAFTRAASAGIA